MASGIDNAPAMARSIVIPVYRSAGTLPALLGRLDAVLDGLPGSSEIILVEDGSPDDTWTVLKACTRAHPRATAVRLMRNYGQHQATLYGLREARGAVVITMDDDLQQWPEDIPLLLKALEENPDADCVFACLDGKKHAAYRNWGSLLIRRLNARAYRLPSDLRSSSFRAMRRPVAQALGQCHTRIPAIASLIYQTTRRIVNVPVRHSPRASGRSNYSLYKQVRLALDYVCTASLLPLHLVAAFGGLFCLCSMIYVGYTLYRYYTRDIGLVGWTSLIVAVFFSSGVILLALGIIGEYLVRILREVQGVPRCTERERVGGGARDAPPGDD